MHANEKDQAVCVSRSHCFSKRPFPSGSGWCSSPWCLCHQDQIMLTTVRVIWDQQPPQTHRQVITITDSHTQVKLWGKSLSYHQVQKTFSTSTAVSKGTWCLDWSSPEGAGYSMTLEVHLAKYKAYLRDIVDSVLDYYPIKQILQKNKGKLHQLWSHPVHVSYVYAIL